MNHALSQTDSGLTDSTMLKSHLVLSGWVLYSMNTRLWHFLNKVTWHRHKNYVSNVRLQYMYHADKLQQWKTIRWERVKQEKGQRQRRGK